jgi:hypothetical protein
VRRSSFPRSPWQTDTECVDCGIQIDLKTGAIVANGDTEDIGWRASVRYIELAMNEGATSAHPPCAAFSSSDQWSTNGDEQCADAVKAIDDSLIGG